MLTDTRCVHVRRAVLGDADDTVVCLMHLVLMVVCLFWRYYVQRYVTTAERAQAVTHALEVLGISTKKIKKTFEKQIESRNGDASEKRPTRPSFNGHACFGVLRNFDQFLSMTHEADSTRPRVVESVNAFLALLRALSPRPDRDGDASEDEADDDEREQQAGAQTHANARAWARFWDTQAKRDAQKEIAHAAARTFVKKLASSGMPAEALDSVYVHFLTCHLREQVGRFGCLWFWSGEGLEHKNFIWKKTGRATAQRGLAGHQNGGAKPKDGSAQQRKAPGREGQTALAVITGEEHGGIARATHAQRSRSAALPDSLL